MLNYLNTPKNFCKTREPLPVKLIEEPIFGMFRQIEGKNQASVKPKVKKFQGLQGLFTLYYKPLEVK